MAVWGWARYLPVTVTSHIIKFLQLGGEETIVFLKAPIAANELWILAWQTEAVAVTRAPALQLWTYTSI